MVNRHVIGAHYGLRDWLAQRVTAVIMLVYTLAIVVFLLAAHNQGFDGWKALFACTWVKVLTQITVLALLWHAWIGVRDIWMDYIQPVGVRLTMHVLTLVWLLGSLVYSVKVVWGA
ncbi:succinate dehydrogenase, hydrophobic membrane anchor protein [Silvimonas amylolytica]|uniref:Succinate dehydrogenase hydrophobic membrane anchor subunit n=1 Tax=Silvimonas amylolytica TaxID=449663 RepID=A0ABQ2PPU9_9NEIS|nr:succinate dehydrogenase, hydrophobic membrane anchor protein [Silvimonas amylolytica]GGP27445.1 succinate dehydrogenase, hydrophobic membrane anchor protein [Silvimonas amylolytica]